MFGGKTEQTMTKNPESPKVVNGSDTTSIGVTKKLDEPVPLGNELKVSNAKDGQKTSEAKKDSGLMQTPVKLQNIMLGGKIEQPMTENPESPNGVNGSDTTSIDVRKKLAEPVPVGNELKVSKAKDGQKTSEAKKDSGLMQSAVKLQNIIFGGKIQQPITENPESLNGVNGLVTTSTEVTKKKEEPVPVGNELKVSKAKDGQKTSDAKKDSGLMQTAVKLLNIIFGKKIQQSMTKNSELPKVVIGSDTNSTEVTKKLEEELVQFENELKLNKAKDGQKSLEANKDSVHIQPAVQLPNIIFGEKIQQSMTKNSELPKVVIGSDTTSTEVTNKLEEEPVQFENEHKLGKAKDGQKSSEAKKDSGHIQPAVQLPIIIFGEKIQQLMTKNSELPKVVIGSDTTSTEITKKLVEKPVQFENDLKLSKVKDGQKSSEAKKDSEHIQPAVQLPNIIFGDKILQSMTKNSELPKVVIGSDITCTKVTNKLIQDPVPFENELKLSKAKDGQMSSEAKKDSGHIQPAVQLPNIIFGEKIQQSMTKIPELPKVVIGSDNTSTEVTKKLKQEPVPFENELKISKAKDGEKTSEAKNDSGHIQPAVQLPIIIFGEKILQSMTKIPELPKVVIGSDNTSTEVTKKLKQEPVPFENELKISKAKDGQKSLEAKNDSGHIQPAVQLPIISSNYEISTWSTPRDHQNTLANIRYDGPIAVPPGYDQLGAPLPVQDTAEVAQDKAARLAVLLKAGGDIYPAVQDNVESNVYNGAKWSQPLINNNVAYKESAAFLPVYNQASSPSFETFNRIAQSNPAMSSVSIKSYQKQSWSSPQTIDLNIKYVGPIALPPGYDESGAPLPVQDTPEVAQAKATRLAALAEAGGDIYRAVHQAYLGLDNGDGAFESGPADRDDESSIFGRINSNSKSSAPVKNQDQANSEPVGTSGIPSQAVNDSSNISNVYQGRASRLPTQTNEVASAYNKYNGPIAIPPGYDESGAPLPVFDTPDVTHVKTKHNEIYAKTLANLIANRFYDQEAEEYNVW